MAGKLKNIETAMAELDLVNKEEYAANFSSIKEAEERIRPYVNKTPVVSSQTLNSLAGRNLHFKCECLQKCGAFKFRGACNAVFLLSDEQEAKGVVTHSSGNHAACLSYAAKLRNIPAYVVIPDVAPKCKAENVIRFGGQLVLCEGTIPSREATAAKIIKEKGVFFIPSSNDGQIISGQGTIALELMDQIPQIDTIIVPLSGMLHLNMSNSYSRTLDGLTQYKLTPETNDIFSFAFWSNIKNDHISRYIS